MNTTEARRLRVGAVIAIAAIVVVHLVQWIIPEATATWNHRIHDRIFQFRSNSKTFRPFYDATVVHVDINQSTLKRLNRRQLNRNLHASAITNLNAMGTAGQLYDFVFASEQSQEEDQHLVEAALKSEKTYFGLVLLFARDHFPKDGPSVESPSRHYLNTTYWRIPIEIASEEIPAAVEAITTFQKLAEASRGLGALNLRFDPDGVYRRYPLLYRYRDGIYPSIVLQMICGYLQVPPEAVALEAGPTLRLSAARFPGAAAPRDIRVPLDQAGNMIINFVGSWERIRHYNFADILQASSNQTEMALWTDELAGKIVVVSEVLSGSSDAGPVPTDTHYPLSGVHANALHTIMTESFFDRTSGMTNLFVEGVLAACAIAAFVYLPAMGFGGAMAACALAFSAMGIFAFLHSRMQFDLLFPNAMLVIMLVSMLVDRAIERTRFSIIAERERDLVEKELEIGRRIQADFFPSDIPTYAGWEIAATIRPAKQVAGDFYDIFELGDGRFLAVVVGDVCDKGLGAAIFMALFRSLIRAICQQQEKDNDLSSGLSDQSAQELLQNTLQQTNDYIAVTHESACMFATVFFAVIDLQTGEMHYLNCGHEPPYLLSPDGGCHRLHPTGPAAGTFPSVSFKYRSAQLEPGDLLFAFTDGVVETPDAKGRAFDESRLRAIICSPHGRLDAMLKAVELAVKQHSQGEAQFDDITMLAVRRSTKEEHRSSAAP